MGTSPPRVEIPKIVSGTQEWAADIRLPGMLHARNVRPPVFGATLVSVDGPHNMPGLVKVVTKGDYVAVVAKTQWQAIQAAHALKVTWKPPASSPLPKSYDEFYEYLATAPPVASSVSRVGDAPAAIVSAARVVQATYKIDFQSHSTIGPFAAVADCRDGSCVVHFAGQKPYAQQISIGDMLRRTGVNPDINPENIRVIWHPGGTSFGRSEADDVSHEAAYLSAVIGAPVRMQWTREESTAWDAKGAPGLVNAQAGLNTANKVVGWNWTSYSVPKIPSGAVEARDTLMGNLMGFRTPGNQVSSGSRDPGYQQSLLTNSGYGFPNVLVTAYDVAWNQALGTGLRSAHLRAPTGPQTGFASEQFEDEIAAAAGLDPIAFRLTYISSPRQIRVLQTLARESGWAARPGPNPASMSNATMLTGRGVAIVGNIGTVAVVKVNRKTGHVTVTKTTTVADNGFVINPRSITNAIKAGNHHAISRALYEGVKFDGKKVTSTDWESYGYIDIKHAPKMRVVMVGLDGLDQTGSFSAPTGAGEAQQAPMVAAIGNAIFDATGVRARRMPMTPEVVLQALQQQRKSQ